MSNYQKYTPAQRKAWGAKMAAARAAKGSYGGHGAYYKRRAPVIRGRGAYTSKKTGGRGVRRTARNLGGLAGAGIGTALGGPAGGAIGGVLGSGVGHMVGEAIKYFTGKGDYQVINNCFLKDDPAMTSIVNRNPGGGDLFRRSEYITDISSASVANTFQVQSFSINPGLESTFEWLSQIAANYEEYEFEGLYFEFRTMSADALNSVNTALGQVIMAVNYNASSPNFVNKQSMENYEGGISGKPSVSIRYFVECSKLRTVLSELYVRQGAVPSGQDQRLYDLGNFQIATNGFQGTSVNAGELWVCYQVALRKPKLFAALGQYGSFATAGIVQAGAYTNALPLGVAAANPTYSPSNTLNGFVLQSGTYITWNAPTLPQAYYITVYWIGSSTAITAPTFVAVANTGCTVKSQFFIPPTGSTTTTCMWIAYVVYTPAVNTTGSSVCGMQMQNNGTLPTAGTNVTVTLTQIPNTYESV